MKDKIEIEEEHKNHIKVHLREHLKSKKCSKHLLLSEKFSKIEDYDYKKVLYNLRKHPKDVVKTAK